MVDKSRLTKYGVHCLILDFYTKVRLVVGIEWWQWLMKMILSVNFHEMFTYINNNALKISFSNENELIEVEQI